MVKKGKFQEMRDDATDRIITAATELFSSYGYAATTMKMIAERANVVPSGIYHYFPGKLALLSAVLRRLIEKFDKGIVSPTADEVKAMGLTRWAREGLRLLKENLTEIRLLGILLMQKDSPKKVKAQINAFLSYIRSLFPQLVDRDEDVRFSEMVFNYLLGTITTYAMFEDEGMLNSMTETLMELISRIENAYPALRGTGNN